MVPALTHQLLGALPTSPGHATWEVRPYPGDVEWAEGQLPTPQGPFRVAWRSMAASFELTVHVPLHTRGTVSLPTRGKSAMVLRSGKSVL